MKNPTKKNPQPKSKTISPAINIKRNKALPIAFDGIHESWHRARAIAALLELCEWAKSADLQPIAIAQAAAIITEELGRMRLHIDRLEKEISSGL